MASASSTHPPPRPLPALSTTESFLCGGLAACAAVTVCESPCYISLAPLKRYRSSSLLVNTSLCSSPPHSCRSSLPLLSKRVVGSSHKLTTSSPLPLEHPRGLQDQAPASRRAGQDVSEGLLERFRRCREDLEERGDSRTATGSGNSCEYFSCLGIEERTNFHSFSVPSHQYVYQVSSDKGRKEGGESRSAICELKLTFFPSLFPSSGPPEWISTR